MPTLFSLNKIQQTSNYYGGWASHENDDYQSETLISSHHMPSDRNALHFLCFNLPCYYVQCILCPSVFVQQLQLLAKAASVQCEYTAWKTCMCMVHLLHTFVAGLLIKGTILGEYTTLKSADTTSHYGNVSNCLKMVEKGRQGQSTKKETSDHQ